jgi:hypothetical protein
MATIIVSVNPDQMEFHCGDGPPQLELVLTDRGGQEHEITFEGPALAEFLQIFRALQMQFPAELGVQ